jgi:hypothetical protein
VDVPVSDLETCTLFKLLPQPYTGNLPVIRTGTNRFLIFPKEHIGFITGTMKVNSRPIERCSESL